MNPLTSMAACLGGKAVITLRSQPVPLRPPAPRNSKPKSALNFYLAALDARLWRGSLGVFAPATKGLARANFLFSIDRISLGGAGSTAVPEPGNMALTLLKQLKVQAATEASANVH